MGGKKIPLHEHKAPHKLDGTVAVGAFLRRIYEKTYLDDDLKGDARKARVIFASDDASELVKEIVQLVALEKPSWKQIDTELAHALRGMLEIELEAPATEKRRISKAREQLEKLADKKVVAAAKKNHLKADELPEMTVKERTEMAAQAIIAACRQAALFKARKETTVDMDQAREHFAHMRLHYETASDAVLGITDKRLLQKRLNSDVALATAGMNHSQQLIMGQNPLPWDRTIASAFDAEQTFLDLMGLKEMKQPRVYSGTMSPEQAMKEIQDVKDGKSNKTWTDKKFATPQQTVEGIGVALDQVFVKQNDAIANATSDLKEPNIPDDKGWLSDLLDILIKTALAGAAGAIGAKIAGLAKGKIESAIANTASKTSLDPGHMFKPGGGGDFFDAKGSLGIASGAAATSMKTAAAQDAVKEFFKVTGYKVIMAAIGGKGKPNASNSADALNIFKQFSKQILDNAALEQRIAFVHLKPALLQGEPDPLHELYQSIMGSLDDSYEIQYSFAMQEWQNFKARAHHGVATDKSKKDKHLYDETDAQSPQDRAAGKAAPKNDENTGSDADIGDGRDEEGALLIEGTVTTDDFIGTAGSLHLDKVRLPDAEDASMRHFKKLMREGKKLEDLRMNKHYKLKFVMYMTEWEVNVGVGPDHGLLESSVGAKDLAVLRVAATGERVLNSSVLMALDNEKPYSEISQKQALKYLKKFIKKIELSKIPHSLSR